MKVVTAHAMQDMDRRAIEEAGIPGTVLMENAGRGCADEIVAEFGLRGRAVILSGKGNNGGDGYVIARLLSQKGWQVRVVVLCTRDRITGDAATNLALLPESMVAYCHEEGLLASLYMEELFRADVIVDALLGTGLRSDVSSFYREAIELVNASGRPVVSVDIPTGIHATTGRILGAAVRAYITVTFACAKLGHVLFPGAEHTGRLAVVDIGIPAELMQEAPGYEFLNDESIRPLLRRRDRLAHKGTFGHCLIVAGSTGKTGAAALCANSTVRAGAGLVTLGVAESLHRILEVKTTEVMTVPLPDAGNGYLTNSAFPTIERLLEGRDAVAVGPGIDRHPGTVALVQQLVASVACPLVIDADGLNALAEDISVLRGAKSRSIVLTPHPGEMARLLGTSVPDVEAIRISVAEEFAREYGVYLVLKGARTIIASPDGISAINGSGNPGMATGGMGDVLTGIIVSLMGQGYSAWDASRMGVFIHGYAADMIAEEKGEIGMTATDVMEKLPYVFNKLLKNTLLSAFRTIGDL